MTLALQWVSSAISKLSTPGMVLAIFDGSLMTLHTTSRGSRTTLMLAPRLIQAGAHESRDRNCFTTYAGYDWQPLIRALRRPTLVIHGELDVMPVRVAHELAALRPNAEITVLPGSGHMPFWEAPTAFFARCESFLSAPP